MAYFESKNGRGVLKQLAARWSGTEAYIKHDVIPEATPDPVWLVSEVLDAARDYPSVYAERFAVLWMEFIMDPTGAPAGTLYIEWSMDDTNWYVFPLVAGEYFSVDPGGKLTPNLAAGSVTVAALAATTRFALRVEDPPPYMRGRWGGATGGSATGMSGKSFGRAA